MRTYRYSAEFRAGAVALARSSGRSVSRIAAELGVNRETLRQWIKTAEKAERPETVAALMEDAEIAALRKQVRELSWSVTSCAGQPSVLRARRTGEPLRVRCRPLWRLRREAAVHRVEPVEVRVLPVAEDRSGPRCEEGRGCGTHPADTQGPGPAREGVRGQADHRRARHRRPQAAVRARGGRVDGVIFHSDHGVQCEAKAFADTCRKAGIRRSMGAVGTSADNAAAESFFASLKREILPSRRGRPTARAARLAVFRRLGFCNHRSRHSTIGYLAPGTFEQRSTTLAIAA